MIGRAGYRRFDERSATMLGDGADLVLREWSGDLRRLHEEVTGDVAALRRALQRVPGIGPVGSAVFCREVQGVWPDVAPFLDDRVLAGARAGVAGSRPRGLGAVCRRVDVVSPCAAG